MDALRPTAVQQKTVETIQTLKTDQCAVQVDPRAASINIATSINPECGPGIWRVVGGKDKGGIIVRRGKALSSPKAQLRLCTGAIVCQEELAEDGLRLHFR